MPLERIQDKSTLGDPPWLRLARLELGVRETPGLKSTTRILQYREHGKKRPWVGDESPWCADFVNFCLENAGIRSTRSARAADYATYGRETYPEPGCIAVFGKADPDAGGSGHVAFLLGVDGSDLRVLGGNQANAVTIARRPASRAVAYRWPVV